MTKPLKNVRKTKRGRDDPIRSEYDFSAGVRGKHAARYAAGANVVILDPDVAREFPTDNEVNATLRAVAKLLRVRKPRRKSKTA
jgi:alpha-beta hydrolase superfamily lysophospholipase